MPGSAQRKVTLRMKRGMRVARKNLRIVHSAVGEKTTRVVMLGGMIWDKPIFRGRDNDIY